MSASATRARLPHRREHDTLELLVGPHELRVSFGYFEADGRIAELFFASRGKIGQDLDTILGNLGIAISRGLQARPEPDVIVMPAIDVAELQHAASSVPVTIALARHERTRDLAALGIRAPDAPGLDGFLEQLSAALTNALAELPDTITVARPASPPTAEVLPACP